MASQVRARSRGTRWPREIHARRCQDGQRPRAIARRSSRPRAARFEMNAFTTLRRAGWRTRVRPRTHRARTARRSQPPQHRARPDPRRSARHDLGTAPRPRHPRAARPVHRGRSAHRRNSIRRSRVIPDAARQARTDEPIERIGAPRIEREELRQDGVLSRQDDLLRPVEPIGISTLVGGADGT